MPDGVASRRDRGEDEVADSGQPVGVGGGERASLGVPDVEVAQLVEKDGCLDRVEARGEAFEVVAVLGALAVLAQRDHLIREVLVVRDERAGVAHRAQVLAGIEAEGRCATDRPCCDAVPDRAVRLACIFDDRHVVAIGEVTQRAHVATLAVEMHGHHKARSGRHSGGSGVEVQVVVRSAHIGGHGTSAGLRDRFETGGERVRRHDDLVAALDAGGDQSEAESIEAARDADTVGGAAVRSPRSLECRDVRTVDEGVRVDERADVRQDVVLDEGMRGPKIEKRHTDMRTDYGHVPRVDGTSWNRPRPFV